jgi:hypothetical protein
MDRVVFATHDINETAENLNELLGVSFQGGDRPRHRDDGGH